MFRTIVLMAGPAIAVCLPAAAADPSGNWTATFREGKFSGDTVPLAGNLKFEDMEVRITHTGNTAGEEIKFTRQVGDFATEELIAKRVK